MYIKLKWKEMVNRKVTRKETDLKVKIVFVYKAPYVILQIGY